MHQFQVMDTGVKSAKENMHLDAILLDTLDQYENPLLHFYEWSSPSATYGLLVNPESHLNMKGIENHRIDLAKRPTGGGIIFHLWDFAFSILVPATHPLFSFNPLENYQRINRAVLQAILAYWGEKIPLEITKEEGALPESPLARFCMASPTKYDVVFQGKKIAGAAQRRTKKGFLHQGSIALCLPDPALLNEILANRVVASEMLKVTFPLLGTQEVDVESLKEAKNWFKASLLDYLQQEAK